MASSVRKRKNMRSSLNLLLYFVKKAAVIRGPGPKHALDFSKYPKICSPRYFSRLCFTWALQEKKI